MHYGYYPAAAFFGGHFFSKHVAAAFTHSLLPHQWLLQTLAYATVTWATSHVVFAVPWALASFVDGGAQ